MIGMGRYVLVAACACMALTALPLVAKEKKAKVTTEDVLNYTNEDLEKLYIPVGKEYPALAENEPVFFVENLGQQIQYDIEPVGLVSFRYQFKVSVKSTDEGPSNKDCYLLLRDFARSKGANVIRFTETKIIDRKITPLGTSGEMEKTFELGRRLN